MAFSLVIRKASSTAALPLHFRALESAKSLRFHGAIYTAMKIYHPRCSSSNSLPSHHYSSAASDAVHQVKKLVDKNPASIVNSWIRSFHPVKDIQKVLPFTVDNNVEGGTVILAGQYTKEIINVVIRCLILKVELGLAAALKPGVMKLKCECSLEVRVAFPSDDDLIQSLTIRKPPLSVDLYRKLGFLALSETLSYGLRRYLVGEIRGMNPNLIDLLNRGLNPILIDSLNKHIANVNSQVEMVWLQKLKKIVV